MKKVSVISLGCSKNLVDSEMILGFLENQSFDIVTETTSADIIIVNTCGFIASAREESLSAIKNAVEIKSNKWSNDSRKKIIVAGCLAERDKDKLLEEIPEIDAIISPSNYHKIRDVILELYNKKNPILCYDSGQYTYLEGKRMVSTKTYAYIKISEGCNNNCTYCLIPSLRGKYTSRSMESILAEAKKLASAGIREFIIIAQDTTKYGIDLYGKKMLVELLKQLSLINSIDWIRLLYCYPEDIDSSLINELATNPKICKYIDIPIQHSSNKILRKMGRRGSTIDITRTINSLREKIPDIVIRTTVIVGFPTENSNDFEELYDFVKNMQFDRLGVFHYSKEEGTPANTMHGQVWQRVKNKRYNLLMQLQKEISQSKNSKKVGMVYKTMVDGMTGNKVSYYGRTYGESPEIDGITYFTSSNPLVIGQLVNVRITASKSYDLIGVAE